MDALATWVGLIVLGIWLADYDTRCSARRRCHVGWDAGLRRWWRGR